MKSLRKRSEKGQSLVELAVGLLLIVLILAGIIDIGRILFYYITMRDAAQEGAVYGAVYPTHCAQIVERSLNAMGDRNNVDVFIMIDGIGCGSASTAQACSGKEIKVTVIKTRLSAHNAAHRGRRRIANHLSQSGDQWDDSTSSL